ncbi:MAG: hypothetical protein DPW09_11605 [Anaerolineae bacterium]|nr:hypothetical protein [Anaerolineae bacterium]
MSPALHRDVELLFRQPLSDALAATAESSVSNCLSLSPGWHYNILIRLSQDVRAYGKIGGLEEWKIGRLEGW